MTLTERFLAVVTTIAVAFAGAFIFVALKFVGGGRSDLSDPGYPRMALAGFILGFFAGVMLCVILVQNARPAAAPPEQAPEQ
jgi:hypothetical protein